MQVYTHSSRVSLNWPLGFMYRPGVVRGTLPLVLIWRMNVNTHDDAGRTACILPSLDAKTQKHVDLNTLIISPFSTLVSGLAYPGLCHYLWRYLMFSPSLSKETLSITVFEVALQAFLCVVIIYNHSRIFCLFYHKMSCWSRERDIVWHPFTYFYQGTGHTLCQIYLLWRFFAWWVDAIRDTEVPFQC